MINIVNYKKISNLYEIFKFQLKKSPNKKFLYSKINNEWIGFTFQNLEKKIKSIISFFLEKKITKGQRILLMSNNRIEWFIFDMAIQAIGAITVPSFSTNNISDNKFILEDCKPELIILENVKVYNKNKKIFKSLIQKIILIETEIGFFSYKDILLLKQNKFDQIKINRNDLSSIIYTSGTSGNPKGVVLSHRSIITNCESAYCLLENLNIENERFLSFLPLSHSYERMAGLYFPLSIGAEIFYSESLDKVNLNLIEVKPTLVTAVPRFYENIFKKINLKFSKSNILLNFLFKEKLKFISSGSKINSSIKLSFFNFVFNILISKKISKIFGGNLKTFVSGGAALDPKIGNFFLSIGINILQGYGQTEAGPLISCNTLLNNETKSVGYPVKNVLVKISSKKEILVKGPNVMEGYWNNKRLTSKTIINEWLHTGDLGYFDSKKRIIINGRKKDLIVTSGGDNISPNKIENLLTINSIISQALIFGNSKPYIVALIVSENKTNLNNIKKIVINVNKQLNTYEVIRKYIIIDEPFTYENGFLTQTLKIKRENVFQKYESKIEELYPKL